MNLEALNYMLMFAVTPLAGAFVGFISSHQAKASVSVGILFAIVGLLFGIASAFVAKPMVDSIVRRVLQQATMFGVFLFIGVDCLVLFSQVLVVAVAVGFLPGVIL